MFDFFDILLTNTPRRPSFPGFCVGIEAPRSVVGRPKLNSILRNMKKIHIPHISSNNSFRFSDVTAKSIEMVEIELLTPPYVHYIPVLMDIVPADVPVLLGLDVLDVEILYTDNVTNRLAHRKILSRRGDAVRYKDILHVPLQRLENHLYPRMSFLQHTFYTTAQLSRMRRNFPHTSATNCTTC